MTSGGARQTVRMLRFRRSIRTVAVVALMVGVSACGARVPPEAPLPMAGLDARVPAVSPSPAPAETEPGAATDATDPAEEPAPEATTPRLGQGEADPERPGYNSGNVTISLSALCVRRGEILVATISMGANAGATMFATFADGRTHGAYNAGESDAQGRFVWRIPVLPTVPPGPGYLYVMATGTNWEGEDGGSADARFLVAGAEGCPQ